MGYCSGHGTYMCGICQCAPDYFGRSCECDAENLSFHGDLEAGCRPDNTTTTLCNNRGDCICGKCECYPRENSEEVGSQRCTLYTQFQQLCWACNFCSWQKKKTI